LSVAIPETCPRIQLLGSGLGQSGSTWNWGIAVWAAAAAAASPVAGQADAAAPCNVHRALSLVAMMQFWDMFETLYLPQDAMRDFGREYRAINHAQIEMLAARVAVRNQCVY